MDELINKHIAKKLRKKGEDYPLSENSKSAAEDFGKLSKIASKIYQYAIAISPRLRKHGVFVSLIAQLRKMRNLDMFLSEEEAHTYTNANILTGFQLHTRASWNTLLPWRPEIEFDVDQQQVTITLPEDKNWRLKRFPERLSRIGIIFHTLVIDMEHPKEEETTTHTKNVFVHPDNPDKSLHTTMKTRLFTDSLMVVIGTVQYYLFDTGETKDSPSGHSLYNATDIMETFHVRNGRLLKNNPTTTNRIASPVFDPSAGSEWK